MTVATSVTPVSPSMVLAIVDEARSKRYESGVIGLRGLPERAIAGDHQHDGQTVRVRPAESALAAREALAEHRDGDWLVVVTDRDDDDLGAGILAHFVWQRLRSPDPWEAVRQRFFATGIDPALTAGPRDRELAAALVEATPAAGWPAAPAGVLTRAHALGAVASVHLGFEGGTTDVLGVLRWSLAAGSVTALGALRRTVGDLPADTTLDWIARQAGPAAAPIRALLARGELADVVPLGVVAHLLTGNSLSPGQTAHQAQLAVARLKGRWGDSAPSTSALAAYGQAAGALLADLVHDRRADADVRRTLDRADLMLAKLEASSLARYSDLLASGLRARFAVLADALRRAVGPEPAGTADPGKAVEAAWAEVSAHRLAAQAPPRVPFEAAVRIVRWLALPEFPAAGGHRTGELADLARRHLGVGAWADAAINDLHAGADDPDLSPALEAVARAALDRRRQQEQDFAVALAAASSAASSSSAAARTGRQRRPPVWYLERLLPKVVIPPGQKAPGAAGHGRDERGDRHRVARGRHRQLGWLRLPCPGRTPGTGRGPVGVALGHGGQPGVVAVRRLAASQAAAEQVGYAELTSQVGKIAAKLFHKKAVDTTAAGWSVSHDVGDALDDRELPLVTVVLNTIDDALDRSDPAGTTWTADAVKHLEPLLARAGAAGRTVVVTADHGHIVERRTGRQIAYPEITSARSRAVTATLGEGEVEIAGRGSSRRHRAVLAVDDTLRYGPLKAGYHGGASAAEVVVPVAVLVPDEAINPADLALLPPQMPAWWLTSQPVATSPPASIPVTAPPARAVGVRGTGPTLFDLEPEEPAPPQPVKSPSSTREASLGRSVVTSRVYKAQRKVAGRLIVTDDQIARLVDALAASNATRLLPPLAAQALGVAQARLRGALSQAQQMLNVEGYGVLTVEPATGVVVLSLGLLEEQLGVTS
jgi:hypothetical protein